MEHPPSLRPQVPRALALIAILAWTALPAPALGAPRKKDTPRAESRKDSTAAPTPAAPVEELALDELAIEEVPALELPPPPEPEPTAAPVPTPPAEAAPPAEAEPPQAWRLRLTPSVALGFTSEAATGPGASPTFSAGFAAEYAFTRQASLALSLRDTFYARRYVTSRPGVGAEPGQTLQQEQMIGADLLFAYDLLPLFGARNSRFWAAPLVGPSFRLFQNAALPANAGGIAIGGRAGVALSEQLDVSVGGTWSYNFMFGNESLLSAHGGPLATSALSGALGFTLAPGTRFRLGYEGEIVTLAASYRLFHSLAFLFDVAL